MSKQAAYGGAVMGAIGFVLGAYAVATRPAVVDAAPADTKPAAEAKGAHADYELGTAMRTLGQRMSAVWFAGFNENPGLVAYELHEIDEVLEGIEKANLTEEGVKVTPMIQSLLPENLKAINAAAAKGDGTAFTKAYRATLDACNSCHQATKHPFIKIVVPKTPPVGNRDWKAK